MRSKQLQRRRALGAAIIVAGLLVGFFGFMAVAQTPKDHDGSAASIIGVAAFAADGTEVGTVSAVTVGKDGQLAEIRLTTASPRGLGERTVAIKQGSFIVLDGAVVLDLSAEEVDALPSQSGLRRSTSA